jgi:hypothetical protein
MIDLQCSHSPCEVPARWSLKCWRSTDKSADAIPAHLLSCDGHIVTFAERFGTTIIRSVVPIEARA